MTEIVKQLLPVEGWHVVLAYREEAGGIGVDIEKLLAWALVEVTYRDGEVESEIHGVFMGETRPIVCTSSEMGGSYAYKIVGYFEHDDLEKNADYFQNRGLELVSASERNEAKR